MNIIEPFELATQRRTLEGHLPVSSFPRLLSSLITDDGEALGRYQVDYVLDFGVDDGGVPGITGTLKTALPLECQRCMEEMELPVSLNLKLALDGFCSVEQSVVGRQ